MSRAQSCKRCHVCNSISGPSDQCKCVVKTSAPSEAMLAREAVAQWARVNGDPFASTFDESDNGPKVTPDMLLVHIGACQTYLKSASWSDVAYRVRRAMESSQGALRMLMDGDKPAAKPPSEPAKLRYAEGMWKIGEMKEATAAGVDYGCGDYTVTSTWTKAPAISKALMDEAEEVERGVRLVREYISKQMSPPQPLRDPWWQAWSVPGVKVPGLEASAAVIATQETPSRIDVIADKTIPRGWMVGVGEVSALSDYRSVHPTRNETLDWRQPSEGVYAATYKGASLFLRSTADGHAYRVIRGLSFVESGGAVDLDFAMQMAMEAAGK